MATPDASAVTQAIIGFSEFLTGYLVALAAVGALTMAIIEAVKKIWDLRTIYHVREFKRWIADDKVALSRIGEASPGGPQTTADGIMGEVIHLTTGVPLDESHRMASSPTGSAKAVFALEIERMMGSIQSAVDSAIDNPTRYPHLYHFIVSGADGSEVSRWRQMAARMPDFEEIATTRDAAKQRADTYATLRTLAKRKLDAFQLEAGYRWNNLNQTVAAVLGAIILFIALMVSSKVRPGGEDVVMFVAASIVGGILSPVSKDLVTLLRKVKQGG